MNAFEHDHEWVETGRAESKEGLTIQMRCDGCGMRIAIGPGRLETEEERFRRRVIEIVVEDLKANGPIRMAMLGL